MRRILHADLDAFFVSVERVRDPSLRGRPVVVGGEPGERGVVACASYEARAFGVRAGMPLARARRLCPEAVFLRGKPERYIGASRAFMAILLDYSPLLQPLGLDEAFLDLTGCERLHGPAAVVARRIKGRVRGELGLTVSIGIAGSRVSAKVASQAGKPDGLVEVPPGEDARFLAPLPVERLPGVGPRLAGALRSMGISTVGQLARTPAVNLRQAFGARGDLLALWARGQDEGPVHLPSRPRSISRETTFPADTRDPALLLGTLRYLAEAVGADLRSQGLTASRVVLKLRWADFTTLTRHRTLPRPRDDDDAIFGAGRALLEALLRADPRPVRLLGIGTSGLRVRGAGTPLLDGREERARRLSLALDALRRRYGYTVVQTGWTFPLRGSLPRERRRLHLPA